MIQLNESKKMVKRNETIDIARGILIILVVIGHYKVDTVHDIIFLFHMPLFFMISGYLIDENKVTSIRYLKSKTTSLMLPYITYLILETIFTKELLGIQKGLKDYFRLLWGGRAIAGVHWFITCFLFSLILFSLMKKNCSNSMVKTLILVGGV